MTHTQTAKPIPHPRNCIKLYYNQCLLVTGWFTQGCKFHTLGKTVAFQTRVPFDMGIESVKKNGPDAMVEDQTF